MTDEETGPASGDSREPGPAVTPPALPAILLDPRPVIAVCTLAWVIVAVAAFTVASLATWRPITVAGLGLAVFGTLLFLWQRHGARRGWRGAQTGLQ